MCSCCSQIIIYIAVRYISIFTVAISPAVIISVWFGIFVCSFLDVDFVELWAFTVYFVCCAICLLAAFVGIAISTLDLGSGIWIRCLFLAQSTCILLCWGKIHWNSSIYQSFNDHHHRWTGKIRIFMWNVWTQLYNVHHMKYKQICARTHTNEFFRLFDKSSGSLQFLCWNTVWKKTHSCTNTNAK